MWSLGAGKTPGLLGFFPLLFVSCPFLSFFFFPHVIQADPELRIHKLQIPRAGTAGIRLSIQLQAFLTEENTQPKTYVNIFKTKCFNALSVSWHRCVHAHMLTSTENLLYCCMIFPQTKVTSRAARGDWKSQSHCCICCFF